MSKIKENIVYNDDALNILMVKTNIPDSSVDLIVTSPPYADKRIKSYGGIHPDKYVDWFLPISEQLFRVLKPKGSFILDIKESALNGERHTYVIELILALKKQGWYWVEEYCWFKKNSFPGKWPNRFRDSWERCLHFTKQKKFNMYQDAVKIPIGDWAKKRFKTMSEKDFKRHLSNTNSQLSRNVSNWLDKKKVYPHNVISLESEHYVEPTNVLELATECSNKNHSAAFPIELPTWFIKLFSRKRNLILDPFLGVGTTALAAFFLDRKYIGIEISEKYANNAIKNLEEIKSEVQKSIHS